MAPTTIPTRLVICVDGTWCTPDGPYGKNYNNISNVYRVCASIKQGVCSDGNSGQKFNQQKKYYQGIGSKDDISPFQRLKTGIFGNECLAQIRDVYRECCSLPPHPLNEVWFYGFSRGAYVVRAVAGLLHNLRALTTAQERSFEGDYKEALELYQKLQKNSQPGRLHEYFASKTQDPPKIKFIGAFDTVKALNDRSLYDISFNKSIQHMRHALALGEDRKDFVPEALFPEFNRNQLRNRSFVQAWFLGAHLDIGGSAAKDGLSLYPLQWMLLESKAKGLVLEFDTSFDSRVKIDNPLSVVFPSDETEGKSAELWTCKVENEIEVQMQDLRKVHTLSIYGNRYSISLNKSEELFWKKTARQPFNKDKEVVQLNGYCTYAPQGTIIHPSVYLILDEYLHVSLDSKGLSCRPQLDRWRIKVLPSSTTEFWNERELVDIEGLKAVRILVCGNVGVGKSSLINGVFGEEVTSASARDRGVHNIEEPFTTPQRPDLLIHDSGGFEAGGIAEIEDVKRFVTERSAVTELQERLHLIWFCLELNTTRTKQTGTENLFKTISQYAKNVPIVFVATKKDELFDIKYMEAMREAKRVGKPIDDATFSKYAESECAERLRTMKKELLQIEGGRFEDAVAVAQNDKETIGRLTEVTARCFDDDKVRLIYISAQTSRIDLKVDFAIAETIRIYRHTVRGALVSGVTPGGASAIKITTAAVVCSAVVKCFGVPSVSSKTIQNIISIVWDDYDKSTGLICAEIISGAGLLGSLALGGMPLFLASGAINMPIVVPATMRLFLMLACDTILILVKAFKECSARCLGQPLKVDIENAAKEYKRIARQVHKDIKKLVPRSNMFKSFQTDRINIAFQEIVKQYKTAFTDGIEQGVEYRVRYAGDDDSDTDVEKMEDGTCDDMSMESPHSVYY